MKQSHTVRLPPETWKRVEAYRARFEVSPTLSAVVETLIERGLRRSDRDKGESDAKSVD
jgi:hypothetical protein